MAGALGGLLITLGLDSAEFTRGLNKADYEAQRAIKRIKGEFELMGKALAVAGIAVGAVALKMGHDIIEGASALDDMAEKTGASVEKLSQLTQQARISGTSLETVELSLVRLSKALHGGDDEAKGAGKALAALGLSADALRNKDTADALRIVAGELNKYQDGAGKTALALDLLGKSGAAALPYLKDLANDQQLAANVTAKQAAEAEELGKALRRLGLESENVKRTFLLDMIPAVQRLLEQFTEGIKIAGGFAQALRLFGLSSITSDNAGAKIKEINDELERLRNLLANPPRGAGTQMRARVEEDIKDLEKQREFAKLLQRQQALAIPGGDTPGERARSAKPALDYKTVDETATKKLQEIKKLYEEVSRLGATIDVPLLPVETFLQGGLDKAKTDLEGVKKTLQDGTKGWIQYIDAMKAADEAQLAANGSGKSFTEISEEITNKVLGLIDPTHQLTQENKALDAAFKDGSLAITEYQLRLAKLDPAVRALVLGQSSIFDKIQKEFEAGRLEVDEMQKILLDLQSPLEKNNDLARDLGLTFTSAFEDAIAGGKKLSDILKALEKDIIKIVTRKLVTEPLGNAITGAIKGGGGGGLVNGLLSLFGLGGGGGGTASMAAAAGNDGNLEGALLGSFDTGTDFVPRTGPYKLHQGERVLTRDENKAFGRAVNVTNHFTINGPTDRRSQAQIGAAVGDSVALHRFRNR